MQPRGSASLGNVACRMTPVRVLLGLVLGGLLLSAAPGHAQTPACEEARAVGRLVSMAGEVEIGDRPAAAGHLVCPGETIRVGSASRAAVLVIDAETTIRLDAQTLLRLEAPDGPESGLIDMLEGALYFLTRVRRSLEVRTPYVTAGVEGTEFALLLNEEAAEILLFEGEVTARPAADGPAERLATGEALTVAADGTSDRRRLEDGAERYRGLAVAARDQVAWTLHYRPLFVAADEALPKLFREVESLLDAGQVADAEARLGAVGDGDTYAWLRDALLSVIALSRNDVAEARSLAEAALRAEPNATPAILAASYARQAELAIDEALAAVAGGRAARLDDPFLLAREAELLLMQGRITRARELADAAVADAANALAYMAQGFAALAAHDAGDAEAAFEEALAIDSQNPLAWLGSGLAAIRRGRLEEGRGRLEIGMGHDPNDAIIRSYLGKAYVEETRSQAARTQFDMAKALDPADPTPWFYEAIARLTANQPVEALIALEQSIARNDNRAVYRSRLLLDQDRAARGASRARIYDTLGFDRLAVNEATRSLAIDPTNHAAHRFLADAYAERRRLEIARVSELLQAQLLQPVGARPVQPGAAISDLNIVTGGGPTTVGINEFNQLFERDGAQVLASGLYGSQESRAGEVLAQARFDRFAATFGRLASESDGFRPNNAIDNDVTSFFAQADPVPWLSLQGEYRARDTVQGDISLDFDPDEFEPTERFEIDQDTGRLGARLSFAPGSDLLVSALKTERDTSRSIVTGGVPVTIDAVDDGYQLEARHLLQHGNLDFTLGGAWSDFDVDRLTSRDFSNFGFGVITTDEQFSRRSWTGYGYLGLHWPQSLRWTLGLSFARVSQHPLDIEDLNPKLGLRWDVTPWLQVRAAAFAATKRALAVNRSLEPTQVAGFNQLYDDVNGTRTRRYALGIDLSPTKTLHGGIEIGRRDLDERAAADGTEQIEEDRTETELSLFASWAPRPRWSFDARFRIERFERDDEVGDDPSQLDTLELPLRAAYFHPSGWFARLGGTFVAQDLNRPSGSTLAEGEDSFFVVDAGLGYRLPDGRGIASLEAANILDTDFRFQDDNFRSTELRRSPYIPEASIVARATINF